MTDAIPSAQPYESVGPMSAQRIVAAYRWYERRTASPDEHLVWASGAGVKDPALGGPTLAELNMLALLKPGRQIAILHNASDRHVWGTAEEICWVIKRAKEEFPDDELIFVFFTAKAHLPRVRFTVRVLFLEVSAQFV